MFNHFHENYFRIFQKRIDYLKLYDEKNLFIIKNFRKIRTKIIKKNTKKNSTNIYEIHCIIIENLIVRNFAKYFNSKIVNFTMFFFCELRDIKKKHRDIIILIYLSTCLLF